MFSRLIQNALQSFYSSIIGTITGLAEIREGISTGDTTKIIVGIGLFLLGLITKEK